MSEQRAEKPEPVAVDVVLGLAVESVRAGLRAGRRLHRATRPVAGFLLRPDHRVGQRLLALAETGQRGRKVALDELTAAYRKVVPVVAADVVRQLDLADLVTEVAAEIDLPEIIRVSTGSVAAETVRDVRVQSMRADEAVAYWTGRVLRPWRTG
ncbi:hypothetical protein [Prauserella cavernicola]|uniref:Uncharacterized protein n=1 Tax=Prauserella cavernicola TaxID=2800127 RepID=A0A934V331_9PSEU|nr:hypothetical protein [Prauserella cavernicola]MBK1783159.1 hypothetical protein [Prauserella cavernicola]